MSVRYEKQTSFSARSSHRVCFAQHKVNDNVNSRVDKINEDETSGKRLNRFTNSRLVSTRHSPLVRRDPGSSLALMVVFRSRDRSVQRPCNLRIIDLKISSIQYIFSYIFSNPCSISWFYRIGLLWLQFFRSHEKHYTTSYTRIKHVVNVLYCDIET